MAITLRRFIPYAPEEFLEGRLGEWVIIMLLCALFIAIAGAVLPKRLTEHRYGKALVVCTGLILGLGVYMSRDLYNFNFESFGFLAIGILIVLLGMVTYGLFKMGMDPKIAFALTYCVMFLSFSLITPSLFDSIAESFPFLNGVFLICFIYLGGRILFKMLHREKSLTGDAKDFLRDKFMTKNDKEDIDRELDTEKKDIKRVKKKTMRLTKREINSIEDISSLLKEVSEYLKDHKRLTQDDFQALSKLVYRIAQKKKDFETGLVMLKRHIEAYKEEDTKLLQELRTRMNQTEDPHERQEINAQYNLEKKKLDIYQFAKQHDRQIENFMHNFQEILFKAIENIKQNDYTDASYHIASARNILGTIEGVLKQLKAYEKYLVKLSKKETHILKKEEKGR